MFLHNRVSREELKRRLEAETFKRRTISFYRYFNIENPQKFRDTIYREWFELGCFGRIYIAGEGINAQMSVPEHNYNKFLEALNRHAIFKGMPIKEAIEDDGKSFYKLTIKIRNAIVADGLKAGEYDVTNVGKHLSAIEFHELSQLEDTIVVDMRNHYESEVGHFKGAICPDVDTFRDEIRMVEDMLSDKKDKKLLLYCTGGIRCEKASAYFRDKGFEDVNQLHGGIIEYARQIKRLDIESNFIGKNFVFDERLGERITSDVISQCHQCGEPCDAHTNCANDDCHLLFIQCPACAEKYNGCCTDDCKSILEKPEEERRLLREKNRDKYASSAIFKSRLRPDLKKLHLEC